MDYVVFGTGFGASVLVLGLLVREVGPRLRYRSAADGGDVLHAEELVAKIAWTRFIAALGSVLAIAGAVFLIVTFACIFLMLSDSTGGRVMISTLAIVLVLLLYWTWAFFDRFGSYGILPEREEAVEEPVAKASAPVAPAGASPAATGRKEPAIAATVPAADATSVYGPAIPAGVATAPPGASPASTHAADAPAADAREGGRLETPEEILAHSDAPVDHGSAEGELDMVGASETRARPRQRPRRARPAGEPQAAPPVRDAPGPDKPAEPTADDTDNGGDAGNQEKADT